MNDSSCERVEELALIGAPISGQQLSALDLLVSSEVMSAGLLPKQ
jgi:hypothetical protein